MDGNLKGFNFGLFRALILGLNERLFRRRRLKKKGKHLGRGVNSWGTTFQRGEVGENRKVLTQIGVNWL